MTASGSDPAPARGGLAGFKVRRLQEIAKSDLRGMSAAKLASEVELSERQFQRAFQASLGMTPKRWLQRQRVEQAAELLSSRPKTPVTEVARQVGYRSSAQLTRAFVTRFGETPSAFRRR